MVEQKEQTITRASSRQPGTYCCVVHNDDITTMDFVVMALCEVFGMSSFEAARVMSFIHNNGKAKIGLFCYDIAMTKKLAMDSLAKASGFPLKTSVEDAGV